MLFKIAMFAILLMAAISLFMALASLVRNQGSSGKTVRMLSYRVGFSLLLLLFLGLAQYMGWVQPHDLKGQPTSQPMISAPSQSKAGATDINEASETEK